MNKFLYYLLGVLSAAAVVLAVTLGQQKGVLPVPTLSSASASPAAAPKLLSTPKPAPVTHHPKPKHTPSPARSTHPASGVHDARCKDGSITHKAGHRGACSGHGGLA